MENLAIYNATRSVPEDAKSPIKGGRLKGYTSIEPMWRIKTLTEQFGACGLGWYYDIVEKRIELGGNDEKVAFVDIDLYVKIDGEWSKPIPGTGGSSFVTKERAGLYTSDECFKMALTDALSVACKNLGMGANVYWGKDRTKYDVPSQEEPKKQSKAPANQPKANPSPEVKQRIEFLESLIKRTNSDLGAFLKYQKAPNIETICCGNDKFNRAVDSLNKKQDKMEAKK